MTHNTPENDGQDRNPLRFLPSERHGITLTPADAAALDALLDVSSRDEDAADPQRTQRVAAWLNLLGASRAARPQPGLLDRTLAAVEADRMSLTAERLRQEEERESVGWRIGRRFGEYAAMAVAASLLVAVLLPGLGAARQQAKRVACASNLMALGDGMATYAADFSGQLPTLGRSNDGNWLPRQVAAGPAVATASSGHSNAANLLPLIRRMGASAADHLACPSRTARPVILVDGVNEIPDSVRGYSYTNLFGPARPRWDQKNTTIVLADRNPLFVPTTSGDPYANSPNHGGKGTTILAADGSVRWVSTPNVGPDEDNIWTIRQGKDCRTCYQGTEYTMNPSDTFLSP